MKIKAIFFDIDGTLVPFGDRDVPAEVKKAIKTMRSQATNKPSYIPTLLRPMI